MKNNFYWGVATAATQNEGGYLEDGKGLSNWDVFSSNPNNIEDHNNCFVACDQFHRYKEDIKLAKELGVSCYRFSINWSRITPDGIHINPKGIEFYRDFVDELIKNDIEPMITLCHWDMPNDLEEKGGWANRELVLESFKIFTRAIVSALKGKVKYIMTFNEAPNIAYMGYKVGKFAPGKCLSDKEVLTVSHNILLAHGYAYRIIKEIDPSIKVSFVNCGWVAMPNDENNKELVKECEKQFFSVEPTRIGDGRTLFYDPIMFGDYPKDYYEVYKDFLPDIKDGDLEIIHTGMDYIAANIYMGYTIDFDKNGNVIRLPHNNNELHDNEMFCARALYYSLLFYYNRYKLPILISENGYNDPHDIDQIVNGEVHDIKRIEEMDLFMKYISKAMKENIPVIGYILWTFIDNFEWASGFIPKMGVVAMDHNNNLKRIKKESFMYYQNLIKKGL